MNDTDTLTVLKLLVKGRPGPFIADATGIPLPKVDGIRDLYGPETERLQVAIDELTHNGTPIPTRAPEPALTPPSSRPAPKPALPRPQPATTPAPGGTLNGTPPAPTVDELVRAARRSEFKRTQALGVKLTTLVEQINAALRAERENAEAKARQAAERAAAQAEVKRLEQALAQARARAVAAGAPGGVRGGARTCEVCGDTLANPQALGAHKRHKHGIASANPKTRSTA